jgi:hypothetical protein
VLPDLADIAALVTLITRLTGREPLAAGA